MPNWHEASGGHDSKASAAKPAEEDKPVFAYIATLPQPQRSIAGHIDARAANTLPSLQRVALCRVVSTVVAFPGQWRHPEVGRGLSQVDGNALTADVQPPTINQRVGDYTSTWIRKRCAVRGDLSFAPPLSDRRSTLKWIVRAMAAHPTCTRLPRETTAKCGGRHRENYAQKWAKLKLRKRARPTLPNAFAKISCVFRSNE